MAIRGRIVSLRCQTVVDSLLSIPFLYSFQLNVILLGGRKNVMAFKTNRWLVMTFCLQLNIHLQNRMQEIEMTAGSLHIQNYIRQAYIRPYVLQFSEL